MDCLFSWLIIYIVVRKFALLDFSILHLQILTDAYTIFNDFSHYNNTNLLLSIMTPNILSRIIKWITYIWFHIDWFDWFYIFVWIKLIIGLLQNLNDWKHFLCTILWTLETFAVYDIWSTFIIFLLWYPHLSKMLTETLG